MPRRIDSIKSGQLFCIRKASDGKVYHVYSITQLARLIDNGTIKDEDLVQISSSNSF